MAFATNTMCISLLSALLTVTAVLASDNCAVLPPPRDGKVQQAFSESDQLLAIYTCDKGFALTGNTILTCVNGVWDKIPPLCVSLDDCELQKKLSEDTSFECDRLVSPRFGRMDNDLEKKVATFNCFKGYHLVGASTLTCENGFWKGRVPQCIPVDCGKPEAPLSGAVEFKDTYFRSVAHYKCDACHVLNGYEQRSCKPSGLWSKSVPVCEPMLDTPVCSLDNLELPEGAAISPESSLSMTCGESVRIQCLSQAFELEGADTATCNLDGSFTWNGSTPSCN